MPCRRRASRRRTHGWLHAPAWKKEKPRTTPHRRTMKSPASSATNVTLRPPFCQMIFWDRFKPSDHADTDEGFQLKKHPHICEGKLPVKFWLCAPDGKRIESTF